MTVRSAALQYAIVAPTSPDSIGVTDGTFPQLSVAVGIEEAVPARERFELLAGGATRSPTTVDRLYRTYWASEEWYDRVTGRGLLGFDLREIGDLGGETLALRWPGGERTLVENPEGRLAAPPSLSAELAIPETTDPGTAPVDLVVRNRDGRSRRFAAALNRSGPQVAHAPIAWVSERLGDGERRRLTVEDGWVGPADDGRVGDGEADVTYRLNYVGGDDRAAVRLVDGE